MAFKINNTDSINNSREFVSQQISLFPNSIIEVLDPSSSTLTPEWGTSFGFALGGILPPNTVYSDIDKFPFSSDVNASDVGDLARSNRAGAGTQSTTHGYHSGGEWAGFVEPKAVTSATEKFPLTAPSISSTSVNNLTVARYRAAGVSSGVAGYAVAGHSTVYLPGVSFTAVDKFPFAADAYVSYVGEIGSNIAGGHGGVSSAISGYATGGLSPPLAAAISTIQRFNFATDGNLNSVGDLTQARGLTSSCSSPVSGYTAGGLISPTVRYNTIDKFPYVNDGKATDVGDLNNTIGGAGSASSTSNGYHLGGVRTPPTQTISTVDKFPFASDTNATSAFNLSTAKALVSGVVD